MKFAAYTYADPHLLRTGNSRERREFVAGNCEKLADFLERKVVNAEHDQATWYRNDGCNTVGCALGWAVMSGLFPGLQYAYYGNDPKSFIAPVMNGGRSCFAEVGDRFFGLPSYGNVFRRVGLNRKETVAALHKLASDYRTSRRTI